MISKEIKERIIKDINKLSKDSLDEVMDFISFKLSKASNEPNNSLKDTMDEPMQLDPSRDPLLNTIGVFDVDPFANKIDDELYGEIN